MTQIQMFSSLPSDRSGNYLQDIAFSTPGDVLSAARVNKRGVSGRRCEDSFVAFPHLNADDLLSCEEGMAKLRDVVAHVRKATRDAPGSATFAGAIGCSDGVAFTNIGDSHVFVVGDKGVVKLNMPHQICLPGMREKPVLVNAVGRDVKESPSGKLHKDQFEFIYYDEIKAEAGENARIILASDGLLDQFNSRCLIADENDFQKEMFAKERQSMEAFLKTTKSRNAAHLAGQALQAGSNDDISVVSFEAAPGHVAFVSDGVGGSHKSTDILDGKTAGRGGLTAQMAIEAAAEEMLKGRAAKPVAAEPFDPMEVAASALKGAGARYTQAGSSQSTGR